jgi:uncharacterized protein YukE
METDIYLNLERLKSEIMDINDKKLREIDTAMQSACNAVATLTSCGWSGNAKDAYMERFSEYKCGMKIFSENVKEFNKQLKTIHTDGKKLLAQGNKIAVKL